MQKPSSAPGLKRRRRTDGSIAYYWIAAAVSRQAGEYPLKTMRLKAGDDEAAATECRILTAELQAWLTNRKPVVEFKDTIASLIDCYQTEEDSPYLTNIQPNTRRAYDYDLRELRKSVGARRVDRLTRKDFAKWHREFMQPTEENGPTHVRRAHGIMTRLRGLLSFGKSMRYAGCKDAKEVLDEMEFETPAPRRRALSFGQASTIIDQALKMGMRSIALGQAIQFELALRQIDVIGHWVSKEQWTGGITWADLSAERLAKRTSKTGQEGVWRPSEYPLLVRTIAAVPDAERVGRAILDERTGQSYRAGEYSRQWRLVAKAAGVPDEVWNMDSRAGAITEADEAGANPEDVRKFATHASFATTTRYIRETGAATSRVAELRQTHRERSKAGGSGTR